MLEYVEPRRDLAAAGRAAEEDREAEAALGDGERRRGGLPDAGCEVEATGVVRIDRLAEDLARGFELVGGGGGDLQRGSFRQGKRRHVPRQEEGEGGIGAAEELEGERGLVRWRSDDVEDRGRPGWRGGAGRLRRGVFGTAELPGKAVQKSFGSGGTFAVESAKMSFTVTVAALMPRL